MSVCFVRAAILICHLLEDKSVLGGEVEILYKKQVIDKCGVAPSMALW